MGGPNEVGDDEAVLLMSTEGVELLGRSPRSTGGRPRAPATTPNGEAAAIAEGGGGAAAARKEEARALAAASAIAARRTRPAEEGAQAIRPRREAVAVAP